MRLSRFFLPILRETPKEAEIVSHRLMLRAGMIRQEAAGIYAFLPPAESKSSFISVTRSVAGAAAATPRSEVAPGFGTKGLSGGAGCSVMVDGADDEENETEVRCRREGEDSP